MPDRDSLIKRCEENNISPMDFAPFIDSSHRDDHAMLIAATSIEQVIDYLLEDCGDDLVWIDDTIDSILDK